MPAIDRVKSLHFQKTAHKTQKAAKTCIKVAKISIAEQQNRNQITECNLLKPVYKGIRGMMILGFPVKWLLAIVVVARMPVPKMIKNGLNSSFVIWG